MLWYLHINGKNWPRLLRFIICHDFIFFSKPLYSTHKSSFQKSHKAYKFLTIYKFTSDCPSARLHKCVLVVGNIRPYAKIKISLTNLQENLKRTCNTPTTPPHTYITKTVGTFAFRIFCFLLIK